MSPKFLTCVASTFRSSILHPISSLRARIPFLLFFHMSVLIPCSFVARCVVSYFLFFTFLVFLFSFFATLIFATACHFASAVTLLFVRNAASASSFLHCSSCCCCLCFLHRNFAYTVARLHQHCNVRVYRLLSFQILISSLFVFFVVVFSPHACWKVPTNLFELLPAAHFTCASVASLVSLRRCLHLTTRSPSFPSFLSLSPDCSQSLR